MKVNAERFAEYLIKKEPFYLVQGQELEIARAAYLNQIPMLLKGPTGCGKTRFMRRLAWELKRPLITVSCHDDLSTSDLVGRYLLKGGEAVWMDGPLTTAVRAGAICYLDEIVEARKDTMVVIHPLADDRRELPIEKLGELLIAPPEFALAVSYPPPGIGGEGRHDRGRGLPENRSRPGALGRHDPRVEGRRPPRRGEHPPPDPCGPADQERGGASAGLPGRGYPGPDR